MGGGVAGCAVAGCHLPRDSFSSAITCLLSKSPAKHTSCKETEENMFISGCPPAAAYDLHE